MQHLLPAHFTAPVTVCSPALLHADTHSTDCMDKIISHLRKTLTRRCYDPIFTKHLFLTPSAKIPTLQFLHLSKMWRSQRSQLLLILLCLSLSRQDTSTALAGTAAGAAGVATGCCFFCTRLMKKSWWLWVWVLWVPVWSQLKELQQPGPVLQPDTEMCVVHSSSSSSITERGGGEREGERVCVFERRYCRGGRAGMTCFIS